MKLLIKTIFYSLLALMVATYLGVEPDAVIPRALKSFDASLGSPIYQSMVFLHQLGVEHLRDVKYELYRLFGLAEDIVG